MNNGSAVLDPGVDASWLEPPPPKLLPEWEPAHRAFFANLAEMFVRRPEPQVGPLFATAMFSRSFVVPSSGFWWSFLESGLWHTIALLLLLIISQGWGSQNPVEKLRRRNTHLVYYRINPAFPAMGSNPPPAVRREQDRQEALHVAREASPHARRLVTPPDIAAVTKPAELPSGIEARPVAPAMPLAAVPESRRPGPQMGVSVVSPAPEVKQATAGKYGGLRVTPVAPPPMVGSSLRPTASGAAGGAGGLQAVAVGPAPGVGAVSARGRLAGPSAGAIAPVPSLQAGSLKGKGGHGSGDQLPMEAVAPAPNLPTREAGLGKMGQGGFGGTETGVVGPPPTVQGLEGRTHRNGAAFSDSRGGVVAPPPSVNGARGLGGPGTRGFGQASDIAAVPPAPPANGLGRVGSDAGTFGDGSSLAVPPSPSLNDAGTMSARGNGGLSGGVGSVVPAAPSIEGAGEGSGRGNGEALGTSAGMAVPPPPGMATSDSDTDRSLNPVVQELPVRIVGLAFAPPSTSFGSSYEVFIAEKEAKDKKGPNGHKDLIKLVYWFLPYQPRLSEFHVDSTKMYKLRVIRDRACDESLLHMTVSPEGQVYSGPHLPPDFLPPVAERKSIILLCYRTTADDYRRAVSRKH